LTPSGGIGTEIVILGMNLTGTTAVTFNGAPAAFTVVAPGEITARVPAGATPPIEVTTPGGILSSNVPFKIPYATSRRVSHSSRVLCARSGNAGSKDDSANAKWFRNLCIMMNLPRHSGRLTQR
jgi:hypothetical protein